MKTTFAGFDINPTSFEPTERREAWAALKSAGLKKTFSSELAAQLELEMSELDSNQYYVGKKYAVTGLL